MAVAFVAVSFINITVFRALTILIRCGNPCRFNDFSRVEHFFEELLIYHTLLQTVQYLLCSAILIFYVRTQSNQSLIEQQIESVVCAARRV
jgi:hypothetical protein